MTVERIFPATQRAYTDAAPWLEETLENINCPLKLIMQISMCFEEAFINIASYAYDNEGGTAKCIISYEDGFVTLELRDKGKPFDPLAKPDPDITLNPEDRNIGGLGIYLVKQLMDKVTYERKDGENILKFTKKTTA